MRKIALFTIFIAMACNKPMGQDTHQGVQKQEAPSSISTSQSVVQQDQQRLALTFTDVIAAEEDRIGQPLLSIHPLPDESSLEADSFEFYICSKSAPSNCSPSPDAPEYVSTIDPEGGYKYPSAPEGENTLFIRLCEGASCGAWTQEDFFQSGYSDAELKSLFETEYQVNKMSSSVGDYTLRLVEAKLGAKIDNPEDVEGAMTKVLESESAAQENSGFGLTEMDGASIGIIAGTVTIGVVGIAVIAWGAHTIHLKNQFKAMTPQAKAAAIKKAEAKLETIDRDIKAKMDADFSGHMNNKSNAGIRGRMVQKSLTREDLAALNEKRNKLIAEANTAKAKFDTYDAKMFVDGSDWDIGPERNDLLQRMVAADSKMNRFDSNLGIDRKIRGVQMNTSKGLEFNTKAFFLNQDLPSLSQFFQDKEEAILEIAEIKDTLEVYLLEREIEYIDEVLESAESAGTP